MDPVGEALAGNGWGLSPGEFVDYAVAVLGVEAGLTRDEVETLRMADLNRMLIWAHRRRL